MMEILKFSKLTPFIVFAILSLFTSCEADDTLIVASVVAPVSEFEQSGPPIVVGATTQLYLNTHQNFYPYFHRFETEAKLRGILADLHNSGMTATFADIGTDLSRCTEDIPNGIHTLSINKTFWNNATDGERELLLFNALGHCFLGKNFKDDASANGICLSLMRSENASCMDNYNANTREIYLDELFGI